MCWFLKMRLARSVDKVIFYVFAKNFYNTFGLNAKKNCYSNFFRHLFSQDWRGPIHEAIFSFQDFGEYLGLKKCKFGKNMVFI